MATTRTMENMGVYLITNSINAMLQDHDNADRAAKYRVKGQVWGDYCDYLIVAK